MKMMMIAGIIMHIETSQRVTFFHRAILRLTGASFELESAVLDRRKKLRIFLRRLPEGFKYRSSN